ncbi:sugar transporter, putative [Pediculus humanus corporis]|uniref:Sugar transporter, putative n=1 Tax=Pediculus humanus subsp. corporis TaxID=121224 RepID=E0W2K8_PEDHC|nr:sugar transporter, putative [Pediculus humanus corporis]EEB19864.1 sugar transporter, putative [Pediculus humanus corporis]
MGWLSPLQPSLQSDNSPLGIRPLTTEEISWIGSLPSVSLILGSPFFGYSLNRFGRKLTCLIATVPNLINYILLLYSKNVYVIYLARLIGGFCSSGGFVMCPIYINETSETRMRGLLGGLMGFIIKIGVIFSYVLGSYTSYTTLNLISALPTIFFLICYFWLPESPVYLVTQNKREEAIVALEKLRGSDFKLIEKELNQIDEIIKSDSSAKNISYKCLFTNVATARGLLIVCGMYTFQMLCGYPAIVRYAVNILQNSSSNLSPDVGAIIIAVGQLLACLAGATLIDKLGRKTLVMTSTAIMCINLIIFSGCIFGLSYFETTKYSDVIKTVPTATLILFICGYALGYGSVPFHVAFSNGHPSKFAPRPMLLNFANICVSLLEFVVVKMYPTISVWLGLGPTFLIFVFNCIVGLIFYYFIMIETKNLEFETVHKLLSNKSPRVKNIDKEILKPLRYNNDIENK